MRHMSAGLLLALLAAACMDSGPLDPEATALGEGTGFSLRVDREAWERWGFRYPVTTVFAVPEAMEVLHRDGDGEWEALEQLNAYEVYNGVEGVRFDLDRERAYVSVGFEGGHKVRLWFRGNGTVEFLEVAELYDGRKVAYTLSNDNWGRSSRGNDGAEFQGMTHDASDKYQASIHATRSFGIPMSIAINCNRGPATEEAKWLNMQEELDHGDSSWEPVVHSRTHPCSASQYQQNGYEAEILGARDDILDRLDHLPYGQYVFEFILPCGFQDEHLKRASSGEFLFLRDWDSGDHPLPADTWYSPWDEQHRFYGIGGFQTKSYDGLFQARSPAGRYYEQDVQELNEAFDQVLDRGGIFYAMFHSDRYENSVIYDPRPGIQGMQGSSLMQHLGYVSGRPGVWYVANGWLYSYRYVAEHLVVEALE